VVLAPGETFKVISKNPIYTQPERDKWGAPMREVLSNGTFVFDGNRIYIRGQDNLYCIGSK
jgi:hypothetical protein